MKSHVITIHMGDWVVAEGKGDGEGNKGEGGKGNDS